MNALTFRTLNTFPLEIQALIRAHAYEDIDELVQACAVELLKARRGDETDLTIFKRARSAVRRLSQDPACYAIGIDDYAEVISAADTQAAVTARRGSERAGLVREVARLHKVSRRRAQQLLRRQVERAACGDLFASGVAA